MSSIPNELVEHILRDVINDLLPGSVYLDLGTPWFTRRTHHERGIEQRLPRYRVARLGAALPLDHESPFEVDRVRRDANPARYVGRSFLCLVKGETSTYPRVMYRMGGTHQMKPSAPATQSDMLEVESM